MECSNCGDAYKKYEKSYRRKSLFLVREKEYIDVVFGTRMTPIFEKVDIFICLECFKLLQAACVGEGAKRELFGRTKSGSYVSVKRKLVTELHTPEKKFKQARMSSGTKYLNNYKFKCGFRWFIKNSKAARTALQDILLKTSRKEVWALLRQLLPITKDTFDSYSNVDWETLTSLTERHAPVLYNVLVGAMTYSGKEHSLLRGQKGRSVSLKPVMGCIISQILAQVKPKKLKVFKTMNNVQMRRAGFKLSKESQIKRKIEDDSPDEMEEDEDVDDTDEAEEMDRDMDDQNGIGIDDPIDEDAEDTVQPKLSKKNPKKVKKQTKQKGSKGKGRRDASPDEMEEDEDNDEAEDMDRDMGNQNGIDVDEPIDEDAGDTVQPKLSKKNPKKVKEQTKQKGSKGKGRRDTSPDEMEEGEYNDDADKAEEIDRDNVNQNGIDKDEPTADEEVTVKRKLSKKEPKQVKKQRLIKGKKPRSNQSHVSHQPVTGTSATVTTPSSITTPVPEKEQQVSEECVKFLGRQVLHEWMIDVKTKETKWYTGYVTNVLKGKDGDADAVYEILYEGEKEPMECELLQDFLDGFLKFKDVTGILHINQTSDYSDNLDLHVIKQLNVNPTCNEENQPEKKAI